MFLNAQSARNKAFDICDYIMQANVDLVFLCETWLRPVGDEADCAALTPPGFCLKSLQSGTGGGIAQGRTKSIVGGGFRRGSRGPHRPPGGVKGLFFCFVSFREGTCIG